MARRFDIASLNAISQAPAIGEAEWLIAAEDSVAFIKENAHSEEMVIYACAPSTLVHAVLAPLKQVTPADQTGPLRVQGLWQDVLQPDLLGRLPPAPPRHQPHAAPTSVLGSCHAPRGLDFGVLLQQRPLAAALAGREGQDRPRGGLGVRRPRHQLHPIRRDAELRALSGQALDHRLGSPGEDRTNLSAKVGRIPSHGHLAANSPSSAIRLLVGWVLRAHAA